MGAAITQCTKAMLVESDECAYVQSESPFQAAPGEGPQLALRISQAPIEASHGAKLCPFSAGDEVAVVQVEKLKGWDELRWRQERSAKQRASNDATSKLLWPTGPRFNNAQRFWGAKVVSSDGAGGFEEHWCLLQVAVNPQERTAENAKADIDDAREVAAYANRFNAQTASYCGADDVESMPNIRVCAPVGCTVIGSTVPSMANPEETVLLAWYPSPQVKKFVFDGSEDFLELPQAFFHYVAFASGGQEQVADLQGVEDGDDIYLLDPVLLRSPQVTLTGLLGTMMAGGADHEPSFEPERGPGDLRFEQWHPRCGELCRAFDPTRRSAHCRKHCGINLPTCGVGGA